MKLSFGFSPCPNDTFMLGAIVNGWIDTEGIEFEWVIADIAELNARSRNHELAISKMSFYNYATIRDTYHHLDAGAALGRGCGPLLIAKNKKWLETMDLQEAITAIPGDRTTANLLLQYAHPEINNKKEYLFSEIEQAVISGEVDLGVIIHENRFTYATKGLLKIKDLGEYWETHTKAAIPLGCIAIQHKYGPKLKNTVSHMIKKSIEYGYTHPDQLSPFIKEHSQEIDDHVIQQHIDLYVNKYSLSLGQEGTHSIEVLLREIATLQKN